MTQKPFFRGVLHSAPIAVSVVPFGMAAAVSAQEAGFSTLETMAMSLIVFAGAAQLTALELLRMGAPALTVIAAATIVNLRFALYSAALARRLPNQTAPIRGAMAYLLTDQAFALSAADDDPEPRHFRSYYFGAACTMWTAWQIGTAAGVAAGASVPPELHINFAAALAFVALAVPLITTVPALAAATTSIAVYILSSNLPHGMGLLPAMLAGVVVGGLMER